SCSRPSKMRSRRRSPDTAPFRKRALFQSQLFFQSVKLRHPHGWACIARHPQVAPRGYGNGAHLRSIRQAGAFEMLCKEPPAEGAEPFVNDSVLVICAEGFLCQTEDLRRTESKPQHVIQIKVMQ